MGFFDRIRDKIFGSAEAVPSSRDSTGAPTPAARARPWRAWRRDRGNAS